MGLELCDAPWMSSLSAAERQDRPIKEPKLPRSRAFGYALARKAFILPKVNRQQPNPDGNV
jgi:hypothetical protein